MNSLKPRFTNLLFSGRLLFSAILVLFCVSALSGKNIDPKAVNALNRARAFIGTEAKLNSIKSLEFHGNISTVTGKTGTMVIYLRSPYQQLQIVTMDGMVREIGLDDYSAWTKIYKQSDPDNYKFVPYNFNQLKAERAKAFENLNFFSAKTNAFRKVEYVEKTMLEGVEVEIVKIKYGELYYIRYFDVLSGKLILTLTETGEMIQETGEMYVDGIRFPAGLTSFVNGEELHSVEFNKIIVNPTFEDSIFREPLIPIKKK